MTPTPPPLLPDVSSSSSEGDVAAAPVVETAALLADGTSTGEKPRLVIQKTHAAFISKLYAMIADESTDGLIAWSAEGDSFKVTDPVEFARKVLPVYFKHGNWQSFVRQLNMYGFHKISDLAYGGIFGDTQLWMFKHCYFQRGKLKMLQKIRRRGPKALMQSSAASPVSTSEPPLSANDQQSTAPQPPSSARPPQPPVTASASPSLNEATSASLSSFYMNDYVVNLKRNIADLQQFNTQLHRENQAMRAKMTDVQSAFAGIMGFLETAIVQPAARQNTHGAETVPPVVDAFRKLASDIAPALSCCSENQECINSTSSFFPFHAERFQPKWSSGSSYHNSHWCSSHQHNHSQPASAGHHHYHHHSSSTTATAPSPPIRPGCCAQPGTFARHPSLSPPSQEVATPPLDSTTAALAHRRVRRSLSSSSGSSSGSTVLGGSGWEQKDMASQVDWTRNHLESSLRETLPAKRPRIR
ncbi:Flocculation suppression protein [Coemansia sp. RSA 1933]|nr:Flocculation suppression protein [Coemansia sp. RSA 1933]